MNGRNRERFAMAQKPRDHRAVGEADYLRLALAGIDYGETRLAVDHRQRDLNGFCPRGRGRRYRQPGDQ
jgi:hypothetical protein